MMKSLFASVLVASLASVTSGQVIFTPVQYQYGPKPTFYYGGTNPRVFERAAQIGQLEYGSSQAGWREGQAGVGLLHPGLVNRPPYLVYTDSLPPINAAIYGFTPTDARNQAYANVPRYFVKSELLAIRAEEANHFEKQDFHGQPVIASRVLTVPSQLPPAGSIVILPFHPRARATHPTTRPASVPSSEPTPLLIIPKKLLESPAPDTKILAAARP